MGEVKNVNETVEANEEVVAEKKVSVMEEYLAKMVEIKVGKELQCTVTEVRVDGIIVSCFGTKKDGYISSEDFGEGFADVKEGDEFKAVLIENKSGNKEYLTLSKKIVDNKLALKLAKEEAEKEIAQGDFEVVISEVCNGGLKGKKGDYTIFVPKSHVELSKKGAEPISDEKLAEYVGKTVTVRKLEDKEKEKSSKSRSVVCSIRNVIRDVRKKEKKERERLREERKAREAQEKVDIFNANADRLQPNLIVPGKVRKIVSFGVFVDVYGFRALCPLSEISWVRDTDPTTVFEVNKEYEFLITKVDAEKYQVTLSYRMLQKKPYELAMEKYPIGSIVRGTVQSIVNFGAFISLEPGVDGLVHKTNVSYEKVEDLNTVLTVGEEIEAKVISFRDDKIGLSIKDLQANPNPKPERSEHTPKQRAEKNFQEKKTKRNDDSYESQEEKDNIAAFGSSTVSNNAFSGILGGLFNNSDDDK